MDTSISNARTVGCGESSWCNTINVNMGEFQNFLSGFIHIHMHKTPSALRSCLQEDGINDQIRVNQLYSPTPGKKVLEWKAWHS